MTALWSFSHCLAIKTLYPVINTVTSRSSISPGHLLSYHSICVGRYFLRKERNEDKRAGHIQKKHICISLMFQYLRNWAGLFAIDHYWTLTPAHNVTEQSALHRPRRFFQLLVECPISWCCQATNTFPGFNFWQIFNHNTT